MRLQSQKTKLAFIIIKYTHIYTDMRQFADIEVIQNPKDFIIILVVS